MDKGFRRKTNRMQTYDYASNGIYFLTLCARDRLCLFANSQTMAISEIGKIVKDALCQIDIIYTGVHIEKYVIMPNHVHILISLHCSNATVSTIVSQYKRYVTLRAGESVWQKSFYDHVVRSEADYQHIWEYMENNPAKWIEDRYYTP